MPCRGPKHRADTVTVLWEVADDDTFKRIARRCQAQAVPELAHSVHAEVAGLAPGRWYFYRFMQGGAASPVGRTRTLPEPAAAVARLRLGYVSCQKWEDGYFTAWRHLLSEYLDAVLFLVDYIYEYPGTSGRVRRPGGGWVISLDHYRRRYALYKSDLDLQAIHAACPWLMTWDDHEVQNEVPALPHAVAAMKNCRSAWRRTRILYSPMHRRTVMAWRNLRLRNCAPLCAWSTM